jgi:endonuclease/exonuclease/phosphatase family metal-dependent hydrolase
MKLLKPILRALLLLVVLAVLYVGGMIAYAWATDYLPESRESVSINTIGEPLPSLEKDSLMLFNWNIGFGGLGKESDFFYDGGKQVRMSEEIVKKNVKGIREAIETHAAEADFILLQEVDLNSLRSHRINEVDYLSEALSGYAQSFGKNYDVKFVPVPFTNPLGGVLSGVSSWSRYLPAEATRYNFEGNYSFPNYLFFLDRCYLLNRFPLPNGKELVVINTHNSAYDDGTLKQKQMQQMQQVLNAEYAAGNYVIVGGDWNQYPPDFKGVRGYSPGTSDPRFFVPKTYPAEGWQWAVDRSIPTNRALKAPFNPDTTTQKVIDFYLISPNVELLKVEGVDLNFEHSDHQPVKLWVRLSGLQESEEADL